MKTVIAFVIALTVSIPALAIPHTVKTFSAYNQKVVIFDNRDNKYVFTHTCKNPIKPHSTVLTNDTRLREDSQIAVRTNDRIEYCKVREVSLVSKA